MDRVKSGMEDMKSVRRIYTGSFYQTSEGTANTEDTSIRNSSVYRDSVRFFRLFRIHISTFQIYVQRIRNRLNDTYFI